MGKRKAVEIDKNKLRNELKNRGLSYQVASEKIYMNPKYFGILLSSDRRCSPRAIQAMEDLV